MTISAANGGTLTTSDGKLALTFPPGAVATDTTVTAKAVPPSQWPDYVKSAGALGNVYSLEPDGLRFNKPVALRYVLKSSDLAGMDLQSRFALPVVLTKTSSGAIDPLDDLLADIDFTTKLMTLTGTTTHFSWTMISTIASASFKPDKVKAFVGDPPWTATLQIADAFR